MKIKAIYRYPVKSLSGEGLKRSRLAPLHGIEGDRLYAFARADGPAGGQTGGSVGKWHPKSAFHAMVKEPVMAQVMCRLDGGTDALAITFPDGASYHIKSGDRKAADEAGAAMGKFLGLPPRMAPTLVRAQKEGFFDTLDGEISIISARSLEEFEKAANTGPSALRFRPNIVIDGVDAWEELSWAGKRAIIGGVEISFTKPTGRCLATHADPVSGEHNLKSMHILKENFGHTSMGVYARVTGKGEISLNDELVME